MQTESLPLNEAKRTLASIQRIHSIEDIDGADFIQKAKVLGWTMVIEKNQFKNGDFVVFIEIDSKTPGDDRFKVLAKSGYRCKTIRLKGVLAQGLALSTTILPGDFKIEEGADVTELLGITKYERPVFDDATLGGDVLGDFPCFLVKTDEQRIQSNISVFDHCKSNKVPLFFTEKLEGTSFTCFYKDGNFGVCSRTRMLKESEQSVYWAEAKKIKDRFIDYCKSNNHNFAIQGEIVGPKIQGNIYKLAGRQLYVYDVYDIDKGEYLSAGDFINFTSLLNLKTVPILGERILDGNIDDLLSFSDGPSALNREVLREGLVWRSIKNISLPRYGRLSFKVVSNKYLEAHK